MASCSCKGEVENGKPKEKKRTKHGRVMMIEKQRMREEGKQKIMRGINSTWGGKS